MPNTTRIFQMHQIIIQGVGESICILWIRNTDTASIWYFKSPIGKDLASWVHAALVINDTEWWYPSRHWRACKKKQWLVGISKRIGLLDITSMLARKGNAFFMELWPMVHENLVQHIWINNKKTKRVPFVSLHIWQHWIALIIQIFNPLSKNNSNPRCFCW